ncbi:MAG: ATP-binding protein [Cyanobacteriota/Melainabacteria group bacterium]
MAVIKIDKKATIGACEKSLLELNSMSEETALKIPTKAEYLAAGGEASLVQLIVSWAQSQSKPVLETYLSSDSDTKQAENLTRRLYGLVAALVCDQAKGLNQIEVTDLLVDKALDRLGVLHGPKPRDASRGAQFEMVCLDHLNKSSPMFLYKGGKGSSAQLRDRSDFRSLARFILSTIVKGRRYAQEWTGTAEPVGGMLYELFRNTVEHALVDLDGNQVKKSVRGMQAKLHSLEPSDFQSIVSDFDPLKEFIECQRPDEGFEQINLMELSIFDSGVGFAETWTRKRTSEMTFADERDAVVECFSRKTSKIYKGYGQGLPHVREILSNMGGFIRLRTGRQSIYYDFSKQTDAMPELDLQDWKGNIQSNQLARVAGSLITLLIPLRRKI